MKKKPFAPEWKLIDEHAKKAPLLLEGTEGKSAQDLHRLPS
jgi:hypothetical protein